MIGISAAGWLIYGTLSALVAGWCLATRYRWYMNGDKGTVGDWIMLILMVLFPPLGIAVIVALVFDMNRELNKEVLCGKEEKEKVLSAVDSDALFGFRGSMDSDRAYCALVVKTNGKSYRSSIGLPLSCNRTEAQEAAASLRNLAGMVDRCALNADLDAWFLKEGTRI